MYSAENMSFFRRFTFSLLLIFVVSGLTAMPTVKADHLVLGQQIPEGLDLPAHYWTNFVAYLSANHGVQTMVGYWRTICEFVDHSETQAPAVQCTTGDDRTSFAAMLNSDRNTPSYIQFGISLAKRDIVDWACVTFNDNTCLPIRPPPFGRRQIHEDLLEGFLTADFFILTEHMSDGTVENVKVSTENMRHALGLIQAVADEIRSRDIRHDDILHEVIDRVGPWYIGCTTHQDAGILICTIDHASGTLGLHTRTYGTERSAAAPAFLLVGEDLDQVMMKVTVDDTKGMIRPNFGIRGEAAKELIDRIENGETLGYGYFLDGEWQQFDVSTEDFREARLASIAAFEERVAAMAEETRPAE